MKYHLLILLLFFCFNSLFAQFPDGLENTNECIRKNRVFIKKSYYCKSNTDSILSSITTYDTLGNILSSAMVNSNGLITSIDTFFYDAHHYLIKKLNSDGIKIRQEITFLNNKNGKMLEETLIVDTVTYQVKNTYDEKDRFIESIFYMPTGDSTVHRNFYNQKGQLIKVLFWDKENGTKIITTDYDESGKILFKNEITDKSAILFQFQYDDYGKNNEINTFIKAKKENTVSRSQFIYTPDGKKQEIITTTTVKKKKTVNKLMYSYYANDLIYEMQLFINGKAITWHKAYYTYY